MFNWKEYDLKHYNVSLLVLVTLLGSIGIVLIQRLQDANERQFEKQIIGYAAGLLIALFISFVDYHFICKFFIPLYLINFVLLVMTRVGPFVKNHYDAYRWIQLKPTSIEVQPSELTKIIMILFFAKFFTIYQRQLNKFSTIIFALGLMALPTAIILTQTDLSTSIVIFASFVAVFFVAGLSYKIIVTTILTAVPSFMILLWYVQQPYQLLLNHYQKKRVLAFLHPELYPDEVYQQANAAKAIMAGGINGKLLGDETAKLKSSLVPVIESDFIFTAVAEAFGFIGSLVVILLLLLFIIKAIKIAARARDYMGRLIASGIASIVAFQIFVNIGVVTSLLPNTGIPLPFVSSGLSALMSNMIMVGVLLNVSLQNKRMIKQKEIPTI